MQTINLHVINTGFFKLDGGAMFGVVPKSIWQKSNPADENNLCSWAMRCLLIQQGKRVILIDNGMGNKQDAKFFSHYHPHGDNLTNSLRQAGFREDDVTDMFLTHLHFDHCGGGVKKDGDKLSLTFRNAKYWSNAEHWKWATFPNPREKASFLTENILPIQESGHLNFVERTGQAHFHQFDIFYASGHTDHMMIPMIHYKERIVCFMADLLPSVGHIPLPYVMGYDTRPLLTMEEKERFLNLAVEKKFILFFEHDPINECCTVKQTDKGVRVDEVFKLSEII
jgi:glyoxylase-like metal-dependent hydrolase (beta-lactamase superfamily II)